MLKAVRFSQFGGPEVLEIVDLPDPHPGPGQVRIAPIPPSLDFPGAAALPAAIETATRVIGTASPANHGYLRSLGAEPVAYGEGLAGRVRALAPDGVGAALDVAGSGVLPEPIELAGGPEHVVTIADFGGAREHGVRFSGGDAGRAVRALAEIGELTESGRLSLPVAQTFPHAEIAQAHRVSEDGHVRGKLVLVVGSPVRGRQALRYEDGDLG